jgi:hypothetical protein
MVSQCSLLTAHCALRTVLLHSRIMQAMCSLLIVVCTRCCSCSRQLLACTQRAQGRVCCCEIEQVVGLLLACLLQ